MIDTHAHLTDPQFTDDVESVVRNAEDSGIQNIITVATDIADSLKCIRIKNQFSIIHTTTGIHPHEANSWNNQSKNKILEMAESVVAIGEIGLDYYYNYSERNVQKAVFINQLKIAASISKPVIIHCRDAFDDLKQVLNLFQPGNPGGVVHCFSGNQNDADFLIKRGFHVSFTGILTFPKADRLRQIACSIPRHRVLLETDCPWMAPHPFRGKRNTPDNVRFVYQKYADIIGHDLSETIRIVNNNAKNLFGLSDY
jgi:TatD DNase family protein